MKEIKCFKWRAGYSSMQIPTFSSLKKTFDMPRRDAKPYKVQGVQEDCPHTGERDFILEEPDTGGKVIDPSCQWSLFRSIYIRKQDYF